MECADVGEANPDIAGIGILLSFAIQAFMAIVISLWLEFSSWSESQKSKKRQEVGQRALLAGNDIQVVTGIALLISALVQIQTLSFYHQHVIYDTVSFVAISIAAAFYCSFNADMEHIRVRYALIFIWMILYLTFTCLFAINLRSWNFDTAGHCYHATHIALPDSRHPYVDHIYISLTSLYIFLTLAVTLRISILSLQGNITNHGSLDLVCVLCANPFGPLCWCCALCCLAGGGGDLKVVSSIGVLIVAMLQYPLHIYSLFTLRGNNEGSLTNGSEEKQWGFAQIVAMVLLATNVILLLNGIQDYWSWSQENKKRSATQGEERIVEQEDRAKRQTIGTDSNV